MYDEKKENKPGAKYDPELLFEKIPKLPQKVDKAVKHLGFISDSIHLSKQTPGSKYRPSFSVTDVNPRHPIMFKESEHEKTVTSRLLPIKKKKGSPTPGDYDVVKAFRKT